jgi:hypothetical protein
MSNTITHADEVPAPPPPGTADVVDEMLADLPAPPRARRRVLGALLTAVSAMSLFLAVQFRDDLSYAMASAQPVDLGEGVSAQPAAVGPNRLVTLRAAPSMAGAVNYSRWLVPGQHLVFPVAGREGRDGVYVQVSQDADGVAAMRRGEFQGRLIPFRAAGGRYAGVGSYLRGHLDGRVSGDTWLLVDGATPRSVLWAPFLVTFLAALSLSNLALLGRLLRPSRD